MARKFFKSLLIFPLLVLFIFALSSCKSEDEKFDLLLTGGGGTAVEQLEITNVTPNQGTVVLEIGESEEFSITAVAPIPRTVSYSWTYDSSPLAVVGNHQITATAGNVGTHSLIASAYDGEITKQNEWVVKVNGPPVITPVTTGTPKVSVGSTINIDATATDPNNDSLTYTWFINGITSIYLTGTTGTGVLTGHDSLTGQITITLQVSDGTTTTSQNWTTEVNHFPQACNVLAQGEICTYSGGPHKGNGLVVNNTQRPLRFHPFKHAQDALGNLFISDLDSHVIWYWNRTAAPVTRLGQTIGANIIQVVAGTGEQSSGGTGVPALISPLNNPRGLAFDDATGTLYIAEYSGSRVKYINSAGTVFIGMGNGGSHLAGDTAFNHDCNNPMSLSLYNNNLYVTCYTQERVKRWDLATGLAYVVAGDGGNDVAGNNANPLTSGVGRPYGLYVDANGIYIASYTGSVVRFVNHTLAPITFWSGNPDQIIVGAGNIATIIGNGNGNSEAPTAGNPLSSPISRAVTVTVRNNNEILVYGLQRDDMILANNSGAPVTVDGLVIAAGTSGRINHTSAGYSGDNFINNSRTNDVYDMRVDVLDNNKIIIADYTNYRVREMDFSDGRFYHLAGSGRGELGYYSDTLLPTQEHLFNYPMGITFDDTNRTLFFADQNNYRYRQTDPYGRTSSALCRGAGDPTIDNDTPTNALCRTNISGTNTMNGGFDLWSDGSLAILNGYGHNVRIWNRSGADKVYFNQFIQSDRVSTVAGDYSLGSGNGADGPAIGAQYSYPNSVKFYDNAGSMELWILDTMNHCLRMVNSAGNSTSMLGLCGTAASPPSNVAAASMRFNRPRGLVLDPNGNIYISDYINHTIVFWNRGATPLTIGTVTVNPGFAARIACLTGAAGSSAENVFATTARCNQPAGLALSGNNLCFAQRNRHNVRCMNITTGIINTVAGRVESAPRSGSVFDYSQEGISATSATLSYPSGIAFDANGDLYISDTYNHLIRKVKLSP